MKTARGIKFFFVSLILICLFNGLVFGNDTDSLVVTENGNVGIGTTNPTAALDVVGLVRANGRIQVNTNDVGFLSTIENPYAPPDKAQSFLSTLKKNTLENGDHNQLRLGFYANDDGGGSPDKRFFTSIEAVVENPNNSTKEAGLRFLTNKAGAELERMRIDGNGNVGIGTTNPTEKLTISNGNLELKGSEGLTALKLIDGGTGDPGYAQFLYNSAVVIQVGAGNGGTYFNFGNVGIGTINPGSKLAISGSGPGTQKFNIADTLGGSFAIDMQGTSASSRASLYIGDGSIAHREIISMPTYGQHQGNVGIGNTSPQYRLDVNGTIRGSNVSPSDARWKNDIESIDDALERVSQLRGVHYQWVDQSRGEGVQVGVIAQEVEEIFPEVVSTDNQGYKSVAYGKLVAPLIEAVKELKAENEDLKAQLEALSARLAALEEK